ncbi:MAG: VanW family protein [Clostridiales bacterium]|jgi:vancomycin resistance protein YoaR|nr:VanW family protein [Clostridiales bacterium]
MLSKKSINKIFIFVISIILVCILSFLFIKKSYSKITRVVDIDKIYENIFVNDINVSLLSIEEAEKKLDDKLNKNNFKKVIIFIDNKKNNEYRFNFKDFDAKYDVKRAVKKAFNYARTGKILDRYEKIIKLKKNPLKINIEYSYDLDFVKKKLNEIKKLSFIEPVNARLMRDNNRFIMISDKNGFFFDVEKNLPEVENLLKDKSSGKIELIFKEIEAEYKNKDLENIKDILGGFSTNFNVSSKNKNRNINISNAVSKINNIMIYPGEVFSLCKILEPYSYENGYLKAISIINGKISDDLAGGICQVSTTLYNTALHAELEIIERQNHSRKVSYVDYAFDATMANNYIDLKIKNNLESAILIESYINKNNIFVNIYGQETRNKSRKIKFINELIETVQPPIEQITKDSNIKKDNRLIIIRAQPGYVYKLYKLIYNNNNLIDKKLINTSFYNPIRGVIKIGE